MELINTKFKAAILIASDRSFSNKRPDSTGPGLEKRLSFLGYRKITREIVPDDIQAISSLLKKWIWVDRIHLILISGGTGVSPTDVTPEATMNIIERRIPGMEEAMRSASSKITPFAMLSRAVVGAVANSLIVNLPGSPKGAIENLRVIEPAIEHALLLINGEKPDQ